MTDLTDYVVIPGEDYKAACDAVREKTGKTDGIRSGELAAEIRGIAPKLHKATVNPGVKDVTATPMEGYDGFSSVTVTGAKLQRKTVAPSGEDQEIVPDEGYYGLSTVVAQAIKLQEKTVTPSTEAQEVVADEGYDGLGKVTVGAAEATGGVQTRKLTIKNTRDEDVTVYHVGDDNQVTTASISGGETGDFDVADGGILALKTTGRTSNYSTGPSKRCAYESNNVSLQKTQVTITTASGMREQYDNTYFAFASVTGDDAEITLTY